MVLPLVAYEQLPEIVTKHVIATLTTSYKEGPVLAKHNTVVISTNVYGNSTIIPIVWNASDIVTNIELLSKVFDSERNEYTSAFDTITISATSCLTDNPGLSTNLICVLYNYCAQDYCADYVGTLYE